MTFFQHPDDDGALTGYANSSGSFWAIDDLGHEVHRSADEVYELADQLYQHELLTGICDGSRRSETLFTGGFAGGYFQARWVQGGLGHTAHNKAG